MASVHYHYNQFPPSHFDWDKLIPLLGQANAAVARFDSLLLAIPNAAVLLSPLTTQEAALSSRIEGTQAYTAHGHNLRFSSSILRSSLNAKLKNISLFRMIKRLNIFQFCVQI